jgi:hypothetical protein
MEEENDSRPGSLLSEPSRDSSDVAPYVSWGVCQREIPLSAAVSPEASDYVAHFCGLECYEQWRDRSGHSER